MARPRATRDAEPTLWVFTMEPNVAYNVRASVWHHVVMSPEAHIVIFEREETGRETTDYAELASVVRERLQSRLSVGRG